MSITLTYDKGVNGWPSFYSYVPDWMIGMNNYFYTFKNGNLYRHNTNETRNNFYGVQYDSTVQPIFNDSPLENKLFKTISLQGDAKWDVVISTDIQTSGYIEKDWFEKKEQVFYAFIRNSGTVPAETSEYALRSLNGIGRSNAVAVGLGYSQINFPMTIKLDTIMSIGDMLYFGLPTDSPAYSIPYLAGQITEINVDLRNNINNIRINTDSSTFVPSIVPPPTLVTIPIQDAMYLYIKNSVAESHGVLGHYGVVTLTNEDTTGINLFAVESDVMKSYP